MSHILENNGNHKNIRDRNAVYHIVSEQSKAESSQLSQTSDESSTPPLKMIMMDHLKQVLMTGNNQCSEDQRQDFISQVKSHSLK